MWMAFDVNAMLCLPLMCWIQKNPKTMPFLSIIPRPRI